MKILIKMISKIKDIYNYWKNPKYMVMKGVCIDDRCVLFIGAYPTCPHKYKDKEIKIQGYCDEAYLKFLVEFKNQEFTYYKSNKLCTIWTFKELIKWRRLLPKEGYTVLEKKDKEWQHIVTT